MDSDGHDNVGEGGILRIVEESWSKSLVEFNDDFLAGDDREKIRNKFVVKGNF